MSTTELTPNHCFPNINKLLLKWQRPFVVTMMFGEISNQVSQADRDDELQVYHLNLLKPWGEEVSEREELGPVVSLKRGLISQFTPVPCGDHLSPFQRPQVACMQEVATS